jgi:hypothetical protein
MDWPNWQYVSNKVKISLALSTPLKHTGIWYIAPQILTFVTRWKWVVSFTLQYLHPREKSPCSHCIGGFVGSQACLGALEIFRKRKVDLFWERLNTSYEKVDTTKGFPGVDIFLFYLKMKTKPASETSYIWYTKWIVPNKILPSTTNSQNHTTISCISRLLSTDS